MSKIVIRSKFGLFVQLAGVTFSYISLLLIARFEGPAAQGVFVTIKSFVDTVYALFMAGLPQALILVINRGQFNVRSAALYIELYCVVIFLFAIPITWKLMWLDVGYGPELLFIPIGIVGMSLFGLTRSLLLTHTDGLSFSLFTVAPPFLILLFVGVHLVVPEFDFLRVYLCFGISILIVSEVILVWLYLHRREEPLIKIPFSLLFSENLHSFAQAVFYNGQLFLVLKMLTAHGVLPDDLGKISTAILPLLALHVLIGVIAPILYNQWSKQETPTDMPKMVRYLVRVALVIQGCSILTFPVVRPATILVFGEAYSEAVPAIWVVLLATFPVALTRLLSPYLQTSGRAALNSVSCFVRVAAVLILLFAAQQAGHNFNIVVVLAIVWASGEWFALAFLLLAQSTTFFAPRLNRS